MSDKQEMTNQSASQGQFIPSGEMIELKASSVSVPVASGEREEQEQMRRFFTLIAPDGGPSYKGGAGQVLKVYNAMGEAFALKRPSFRGRGMFDTEEQFRKHREIVTKTFRREFVNQHKLSQLKGFPKTYGLGMDENGIPCIVMEWVEGETLSQAAKRLSKEVGDTRNRVAPTTVAQIGLELFSLIERFDGLEGGFAHRDISPRNVILRNRAFGSVGKSAEEPADLCLIDFGSGTQIVEESNPSLTSIDRIRRGATPEYAAPEMLIRDLRSDKDFELRKSSKIDVYAASSILYELLSGYTPYQLAANNIVEDRYYHHKMDNFQNIDSTPQTAHSRVVSVDQLAGQRSLCDLSVRLRQFDTFDEAKFIRAINQTDTQLGFILMRGLTVDQAERADASQMRDMLQRFLKQYLENVERAYLGQGLLPFLNLEKGVTRRRRPVSTATPTSQVLVWKEAERPAIASAPTVTMSSQPVKQSGKAAPWILAVALPALLALACAALMGGNDGAMTIGANVYAGSVPSVVAFLILVIPAVVSLIGFLTPRKGETAFAAGAGVLVVCQAIVWVLLRQVAWVNPAVEPVVAIEIALSTLCVLLVAWFATKESKG